MAKAKGIIQLEGTIGGINYYMRKGQLVARNAGGGFNGEAIKNDPGMVKVRQNGSEFGGVSKMVKAFKMGIAPLLFSNPFPELHGRLMRLFTSIKNEDLVSERGTRTFEVGLDGVNGRRLMTGFRIPEDVTMFEKLSSKVRFDWQTATLQFCAKKEELFTLTKKVAAVSIQVGVLKLGSDEAGCVLTLSEVVFVATEEALPAQITVPLTHEVTERSLAIVSMHLYERIAGKLQPMPLKKAFTMEVVSVF